MWEVVYEGDKINLFGMLTYDTRTGQASMDNMVAMMQSGAKDALKKLIGDEKASEGWNFVWTSLKLVAAGAIVYFMARKINRRMREMRLQNQ